MIQYTQEDERKLLPVGPPLRIKVSTTLNFAEPINLGHNKWFELESVRRVSEVAVLTPPRNKKHITTR